jgi:hypothetical protein
MYATSYDLTGKFTIEVDGQCENLSAGTELDPQTGQPYAVKWLPCSHCNRLHKVRYAVVSFFCDDDCADEYEKAHPSSYSDPAINGGSALTGRETL